MPNTNNLGNVSGKSKRVADSINIINYKKVKFNNEKFETSNLNNYVHGKLDYSIGFINPTNGEFDTNKFIIYFIREVCANTNSSNIVSKYIQILEQLKAQIDILNIKNTDNIIIYLLDKFIRFIKKFDLIGKLQEEITELKDNFNPDNLINKLNEKIVIDNLLILKNTNVPILNSNDIYIDLISEIKMYKEMIKNHTWEESVKYLRGFYSIYLTMLMDILHNIDKIKSIEQIVLEYDIKFLQEFKIENINDLSILFNQLDIEKYGLYIKLLI